MKILIAIILIISLVIVLIDIIPILFNWISRIYIGRYNNQELWKNALINMSIKWLNNTPKIKVTDNTRLTIIDRLKGNYTKSSIQHWQQAALILGLKEFEYNNPEVNDAIDRYLSINFDSNGQWKEKPKFVDCAILSYAIMKQDKSDKYKQSYDYTYNLIKDLLGEDGTVKYRKSMPDYRYVDTVGFICPFLMRYGVKYNDKNAIEISIKQIKQYFEYGFDKESRIPFHAYDIKNKYKLGLCGWGRGLGWFAIGLIDTWNELPKDSKYKNELENIILEFTQTVLNLQLENGGFGWAVTRKEAIIDSSTTATLAWYLLNVSNIKSISDICKNASSKALEYLMTVTRRSGAIDFSQGDTKDIGVYSMLFDILPFTQGFALRTIAYLRGVKGIC